MSAQRRGTAMFALVVALAVVSSAVPTLALAYSAPTSSIAVGAGSVAPQPPTVLPAAPGAPIGVAPSFTPSPGIQTLGPVGSETPISLAVGLASQDPGGLAALLVAEYGGGTSATGRFPTAAELARAYGAPASAVRAAESYFASEGLSVTVSPDHLLLFVEGPAAAVGRAFGTHFVEYRDPTGHEFYSHPTPATLPAGIPWTGALGLDSQDSVTPFATEPSARIPMLGPAAGCSSPDDALTPCQVWNAYNATPLLNSGVDGAGYRIGVVDAYSSDEGQAQLTSDLATFTSTFGVSSGPVDYAYPIPTSADLNASGVNVNWSYEDALDLEWARASAPGATIEFTFSPNGGIGLYEAVDWLVAQQAVNVISLSWGEPDVGVFNAFSTPCSSECNASTDGSYGILGPVFQFAAAEGISVFAASGDCGAAGGTSGVSTQFPASDPAVTGVGGTILSVASNGSYLSEVAWSGNSTGAKSPGCINQGGSGGGYSPFPRPWWQTGLGVPAHSASRGEPDVAAVAGTSANIVYHGSLTAVGGTSLATPIWAGFTADFDQDRGAALGFLNPTLYRILNGSHYASDFHDIVSGSNGYPAGVGWDPVTGVGSPNVAALAVDLTPAATYTPSGLSTFLTATPSTGPAPLSVQFAVYASGGSGQYPLVGVYYGDGNASFASGGVSSHTYETPGVYAAQSYVADSSGNFSASPPALVLVGTGSVLNVTLSVSDPTPTVGAPVTLETTVHGGVSPYSYSYYFGDGTFQNWTNQASLDHTYGAPGDFCAVVVVSDSANPVDGGISSRVGVAVGGAPAANCESLPRPLTVTAVASPGVRDAPADYPDLFNVTGGSLGVTVQYSSSDPYVGACGCTIFRSEGNYSVSAAASDPAGQIARNETNVTVAPPLVGSFSASVRSGPAPLTVRFAANASGGYGANVSETFWSFGNGDTAVGAEVVETYSTPGSYLAIGSLSDRGHGNSSEGFLLDVLPAGDSNVLVVTGTVEPATHLVDGALVAFTAQATTVSGASVAGTTYWDLGNGSSAFGPRANLSYFGPLPASDANTLTVEAVLTDAANGTTVSVPFTLPSFFAEEPGDFFPRASALSISASAGPPSGIVPFGWNGSATVTGPGTTAANWTFGDGTEPGSGDHVVHPYALAGNYTATVVGSDSYGDSAHVTVAVAAYPVLSIAGGPSSENGVAPFSVSFSAVATGGAGEPYSYRWNLGDGTTSNASAVSHTYDSVGTYAVTLSVTDRQGHSFVDDWTITVSARTNAIPWWLVVVPAVGAGVALAVGLGRRGGRPTADPGASP